MSFANLDKIYHLIKNNDFEKVKNNFCSEEIECVLRLRFKKEKKNIKDKIYSVVEVRPNQKTFRDKLIIKFNYSCAIRTNIDYEICQACHLVPYSECDNTFQKEDEFNGILLCNNLHVAFDKNFFTIDENTCTVKMLVPECYWKKYDIEGINGLYIPELDNIISKNYLFKRNKN